MSDQAQIHPNAAAFAARSIAFPTLDGSTRSTASSPNARADGFAQRSRRRPKHAVFRFVVDLKAAYNRLVEAHNESLRTSFGAPTPAPSSPAAPEGSERHG